MSFKKLIVPAFVVTAAIAVLVGSMANAAKKESAPANQPEMKLPPGWTMDDMKACMEAGTPGKMHKILAKDVGEWTGKTTMWMGPDSEPKTSECTSSMSSLMDGRFIKVEMKGDMPGAGPFQGGGIYGYDNVMKKFVSSWIDNQSTGIMQGDGELSDDGKSITWNYKFSCPITKKRVALKEVDTTTGPDTKKLEMWTDDPKTGKNYKMMSIEFTRK
jgi:hypothetical protein